MIKTNILRAYMVTILFVLCLNLISVTMAAAGCGDCNNPSTSAGNAEFPCSSTGAKLTIVAKYINTDNTIDSGHTVTLSATGGRPSYKWSTTSKGYSLSDNNDGTKTLSVINGTCGTSFDIYATVTVTDACGNKDTTEIRHMGGKWKILDYGSEGCFADPVDCSAFTKIIGKYQWKISLCRNSITYSFPYPGDCASSRSCPSIPSAVYTAGDPSLNPAAWQEAINASGKGTLVCCKNSPTQQYSVTFWNSCSEATYAMNYSYQLSEWTCQ